MEYPCLNKVENEFKFLLMPGTNKQSFKTYILFKGKNNSITPTDIVETLAFELRCNVISPSLSFLVSRNPCNVL